MKTDAEKPGKSGKPVSTKGAIEKVDKKDEGDGEERKKGLLSWMLGWVALPGVVLGGIFGGGVLVGANFHESWITRMFVWIFG